MSFPYHDAFWTSAADFVGALVKPGERILAPDVFWWRFPKIHRYRHTFLAPAEDYDWAILHKGELDCLSRPTLERITCGRPVFANEVFVVWHRGDSCPAVDDGSPHLRAFFERFEEANRVLPRPVASGGQILPDPGCIQRFEFLSDREVGIQMDAFWKRGGYVYETVRDKVYYEEIDRHIAELFGDGAGRDILDLACGRGRLKGISDTGRVTGIDLSATAIELARTAHAARPNFRFLQMSAQELAFSDASFDDVLFVDALEHVFHPRKVLTEAARVLRPGGRFLVTSANRDSLNQILTRKLGFPDFVTNFQHIREYTYTEMVALLEEAGFAVRRTAGVLLHPYWGVPGVDEVTRRVNDHDAELVELLRKLGELVGAEHAYLSVILAEKKQG